jgi:hypothetical protein
MFAAPNNRMVASFIVAAFNTPSNQLAKKISPSMEMVRGRGGIGRRAALKMPFREECRFDSDRPHHQSDLQEKVIGRHWSRKEDGGSRASGIGNLRFLPTTFLAINAKNCGRSNGRILY